MAFDADTGLQVGILEIFYEAGRLAAHPDATAWGWHPVKHSGEDRTDEKTRYAARRRARTLAQYTARLRAGERPTFKRGSLAACKLWRQAAAAVGVELHGQ